MRLNLTSPPLLDYWQAATAPVPIVVVGGGRWGRTWANVIAAARDTAEGLVIAARTDPANVRAWLTEQRSLDGAMVVATIEEAMRRDPRPMAAIIASRPRDHVRDVTEALRNDLHVLVEKPISPRADESERLIAAARSPGQVLTVGTEFAFLPAFHATATALAGHDQDPVRLILHWGDAAREQRHGGLKIHHEEISILADLLPHAFSISQIFARGSTLHLDEASLSADGNSGRLAMRDGSGALFELRCNRAAPARRRMLEISLGRQNATVDFAEHPAAVLIDGKVRELAADLAALSSTLRLELGAFLMQAAGSTANAPVSAEIADLVRLQRELELAGV